MSFEKYHINKLDNERIYADLKLVTDHFPHFTDTIHIEDTAEGVPVIRFVPFAQMDFVEQGFSTRLGGVSDGMFSSMNLTFNRGDDPKKVAENFRRMAEALHILPEQMVYSRQTHTANILKVTQKHRGMGVTAPQDFDNIDGLITAEQGICLVTAYADCIPVIAADPVARCIGAAHAGWRGTVGNIAAGMIKQMQLEYGSHPEDVTAFIGPGICVDCYEVSQDVAECFHKAYAPIQCRLMLKPGKADGKWQLNLPMANFFNLSDAGVRPENIYISDICTCCNPDFLYSHRASGGKRGVLCNFIYIR